ncbi:MAG: alanine racemase C-terminal domain-containing protein [Nitrospira sp.]
MPQAVAGTDAVIIGRQGADAITADDLAAWQKTISYEVLCGLGPRVRRVYKEN